MATINFPTNRDQLKPAKPSGALVNGDLHTVTVDSSDGTNHNVDITYMYVKPASPNVSAWWKSMGRVNSAQVTNKIEQLDSFVEVTDTGSDG